MSPELIEKAVWLSDLIRARNVIALMDHIYDKDIWTGGMLFIDTRGGFLLVACFDPDSYIALGTPFETLFPEEHLRSVTLEEACFDGRRYRPWLAGDIPNTLRALRILPT